MAALPDGLGSLRWVEKSTQGVGRGGRSETINDVTNPNELWTGHDRRGESQTPDPSGTWTVDGGRCTLSTRSRGLRLQLREQNRDHQEKTESGGESRQKGESLTGS